jgi:hypothetical protein
MGVDFATWVYSPNFDMFARTLMFFPVASQPGVSGFAARGIFDTNETDVQALDGSIYTDARTELDIFQPEWSVYPKQGDMADIPWEDDVDGGLFVVADVHGHGNAGGELTCTLQRYEQGEGKRFIVTAWPMSLGSPSFAKPPLTVILHGGALAAVESSSTANFVGHTP